MTYDEWRAFDLADMDWEYDFHMANPHFDEFEDVTEEFSLRKARDRITRVKDRERENQ